MVLVCNGIPSRYPVDGVHVCANLPACHCQWSLEHLEARLEFRSFTVFGMTRFFFFFFFFFHPRRVSGTRDSR
jgi:hypothetical protein